MRMIDLVGKRRWFFLISALVIISGMVILGLFGLNLGLDFTSGSTMTLVFNQPVEQADLRQELADQGFAEAVIQNTKTGGFVVETAKHLSEEQVEQVRDALEEKFGARSVSLFVEQGERTTLTVVFAHMAAEGEVREVLEPLGVEISSITGTQEDAFFVRTRTISQEELDELRTDLETNPHFGPFGLFDFYSVSPVIATETVRNAGIAVGVACVGIMLYLAWAFRSMPRPFLYGGCALAALVHDILIVVGIFAILGVLANVEVDALFIAGVLAVIGYSVNDTVVVFDRLRENLGRRTGYDLESAVNDSLVGTLSRSLSTSLTTLLVILALFLLGGPTIHNFVLVLLIGIVAGTYSSLCIASPLLVVWDKTRWRRLFRWIRLPRRLKRRG